MTGPSIDWGPETDYQVPEDIEAERSLLATLCHGHQDTRRGILPELEDEDFVHPSHRKVLTALRALTDADEEVNALTVKDALSRAGTLNQVGGFDWLVELLSAGEVGRPAALVKILKRKHKFRDMITLGSKLQRAGITETGDPDGVMTRLVAAMTTVSSSVLTVHDAGEFLDHPVPETRWIIPSLIPQGVPQVLASKGGLGKSFLSLQLCIALATGKPFFDWEAQEPCGAAYFGLEDGKDTIHKRLISIVDGYKFCQDWTAEDDDNIRQNFSVISVNWDSENVTTYLPSLIPSLNSFFARSKSRPGLIVLDTLARFAADNADENSVQALRPILSACSRICASGWTSLVLHHVGKGQDGAKTKDKPTLADRMSPEWVRGSSAIVDNFRGVLQLVGMREDEAEKAGLDPDKARAGGYLILGQTKTNGTARSEWRLLEQSETGAWFLPPDAYDTLARLRGAKAVETLSKQMSLLVDIFHASRYGQDPDTKLLTSKYCDGTKNPAAAFRLMLFKLRGAGFLQKGSILLTISGVKRVYEMGVETERTTGYE